MIKEDQRHEAEGVSLVEDSASLRQALNRLERQETAGLWGFVSQDYVSCGGNVLRAVIMGRSVITYWKRPGREGDVITTVSKGGLIDHHWRLDLQRKAESQALALADKTRINLAAVDFLFSLAVEDPEPLFLEINYFFGRRGLGGTMDYYRLLHGAVLVWLSEAGFDSARVRLV